jgi:solute carrier family 13 (sodium-dependent dicarboxylate transporter), member 2/3/5
MDPRRACWESSTEDVTRPLLPVHDDRPAGRCSCSGLGSLLTTNKYLAVASGPLACAVICALGDFGGHPAARNMLGVLAWVFLWWITDAVPLGVASMAPLFLFPAFGVSSADAVAKAYMDDVISLVLGSFILALAIEHYGIHRRLALNVRTLRARAATEVSDAAKNTKDTTKQNKTKRKKRLTLCSSFRRERRSRPCSAVTR